jgi:transposase
MTFALPLSTQARKRLQAGELILDGFDNEEIAEIVKVSIRSVSRWRKMINENKEDLCALLRKKGSGKQSRLTDEQKQQLKEIILKGAVTAGYPHERWTSKIVADLVQKVFAITLAPRTIRQLLPTLGLSAQMPTVQSRKRDEKAVSTWVEKTLPKIKKK